MSESRGNNAAVVAMATLLMLLLIIHCGPALATIYTVGDSRGWTFRRVGGWENGKNFKAGDTLVFKYTLGTNYVVAVDKASYDSCSVPPHSVIYSSGEDTLTLEKGPNYFISSPRHCRKGVKIAAFAV